MKRFLLGLLPFCVTACQTTMANTAAAAEEYRLVKSQDKKSWSIVYSSDGVTGGIMVDSGFVPEPDPNPNPNPQPGPGGDATGDCSSTVYEKTGRKVDMPGKLGTRNYASGKPSEPTWESEKNVDKTWSDYELTAYFTMNKHHKGDEDNAVFKMYGPNHSGHNKAWYVFGISSDGKAVCGGEDEHPGKNPKWDCSGGDKTSFGDITTKRIGLKTAIWTDANGDVTLQSFVDIGDKKWVKMADQKNPGGRKFVPKSPQNLLLRVDGYPKIKVDCATAQEIKEPVLGLISNSIDD